MDSPDVSSTDAVREMYDSTAESYSSMMDSVIDDPMYADILQRLKSRLENIPGMLVDAPCGSGHLLSMYHETCDNERRLFGVDLSSQMAAITQRRLGAAVDLQKILADLGFTELKCDVEFDEDMAMDAVYIEASK